MMPDSAARGLLTRRCWRHFVACAAIVLTVLAAPGVCSTDDVAPISVDVLRSRLLEGMRKSMETAMASPDKRNSVFAWTWSYYALGSLKAAQATGDQRFLDPVAADLKTIA